MQDGADPPPPTPTLQFTAEVARMLQARKDLWRLFWRGCAVSERAGAGREGAVTVWYRGGDLHSLPQAACQARCSSPTRQPLQALEAATPATLARRPLDRPARYSLVATGTLLDMERWVGSRVWRRYRILLTWCCRALCCFPDQWRRKSAGNRSQGSASLSVLAAHPLACLQNSTVAIPQILLPHVSSYDASGARQGGTSPSPAGADPGTPGQLAASGGSREPQAVPRPAASPTPDLVDAEVTALRDQASCIVMRLAV